MPTIAYHLTPKSAFHFGREGLEQQTSSETFPSDSLFSALIATYAELHLREVTSFIGSFPDTDHEDRQPPWKLSSLFPMVGDLTFLPKPRLRLNSKTEERGKDLKKISYVSPIVWQQIVSGKLVDNWKEQGLFLQSDKLWLTEQERVSLPFEWRNLARETLNKCDVWKTDTVPRVTIDRRSNASNIYQTGRTVYADYCGLWLMAEANQNEQRLDELMAHLGDRGIGGERSSGYGGFTHHKITPPNLPVGNSNRSILLSRYVPTLKELQSDVLGEQSSYELIDVGGWSGTIGSPAHKRKRIRMIEAGSVMQGEVVGRLVDVSPSSPMPHPIYRSGIALGIRI